MPKFSAFTPFGMLKFSSAPSRGERIYRSMYAAKAGAFNLATDSYQEAKVYAQAMGIARGRYALERAFNNQNPFKSIELLPSLEKNWSVIPSETDTLLDRQLNVAARMMLVRGAPREAITAGLQTILTTHFIALRTFLPGEVVTEQPAGTSGPLFARHDLPFKLIRLTGAVAHLLAPTTVPYTNADPSAGRILVQKGDVFMVQPENTGLAEVVTVISATADDLTATFTKAHDIDAYATTQNWVNWTSTQRIYLIVVDAAAAIDTETVRRVNDFMSKVSRGVSQWDIVEPTTPGALTYGPFTLDVSPVGMVPLAQANIFPVTPPDYELLPNKLTTVGGLLRLFGRHLNTTTNVQINAINVPFTIVSDYQIDVTVPATYPAGILFASAFYPVTLFSPAGNVTRTLEVTPADLVVTSLVPAIGPAAGVATGSGFLAVTSISQNGFALGTPWVIVDDTTITFVTDPYGAPGVHTLDFGDSNGRTTNPPYTWTS